MKILHMTYHCGCSDNINFVFKKLNYNIETQYASWNYNIGHNRSLEIWNKYKDYYNSFNLIITSDTAPLSRILLQNNYSGKLIIWVCNRFDYSDGLTNDCAFPDEEYYHIFKNATDNPNVKIFSYTKFEHEYAEEYRNIKWSSEVIKPSSFVEGEFTKSAFPKNITKEEIFFIPPYHNDTIFLDLNSKCEELNIPTYSGRYFGPLDLKGIKGIIHIPYAWSNLALFENWYMGNVYFIPSKEFILELSKKGNFFWSPPFPKNHIDSSEWYCPEHKDLFIYFDSWAHLRELVSYSELILEKKKEILKFSKEHTIKTLEQWKNAIERWD